MPRSLVARAWVSVRAEPRLGVLLVAGATLQASGQALLAAAGGSLARSLAGGTAPMDGRSSRWLLELGSGDPVLGLATGGLIAACAKAAGSVVAGWAEARIAGEVGAALRLEVLERIHGATSLRAPRHVDHGEPGPHVGADIAHLASLTTDVTGVEQGVARGVFAEARAALQLAPLVALLVALAPRLAGSAALALVGFAALVTVARRALKIRHARAARESAALLGAADEAVRHAELWATYGAERRIRAHVASLGRTLVRSSARLRARAALLSGTSEVLGALALVLTLGLLGAGALGGVERAAIVPFAIAFFMTYKPLRELVEGRLARARGEAALRSAAPGVGSEARVDGERSVPESVRAWAPATLRLDGLVAWHGHHAPLTVSIAPGSLAAIVGPTGVGKTSLLRVLLGLEVARAGRVFWGERELTQSGVGPGQRPFAWVPQDAPVLADTVAANVALSRAPADDDDEACAARVLAELGVGDLGEAFGAAVLGTERRASGGERQWIAVARALATGLPVLLLDEPTSALDPGSQERMLGALARLRGKRTVLLVTHRPEPLAIADVVLHL